MGSRNKDTTGEVDVADASLHETTFAGCLPASGEIFLSILLHSRHKRERETESVL